MRHLSLPCLAAMLLLGLAASASAQEAPAGKIPDKAALRSFTTPYYMMHTDLDDEGAREAWIRITKMFETYKRRTAGFSGDIRGRFPFFLYKHKAHYYNDGGPPGSGGVFIRFGNQSKLMVIAGEKPDADTWHTVQHEGFHQFAAAVIRGDLPVWVNEGLAEYFGEAVFTGDDFITGVIPPGRLRSIQAQIKQERFIPLAKMLTMTHKEWNEKLKGGNYDQAWAMIHFLAHGDDGKYQKGLVAFMNALGRGSSYEQAWVGVFGRNAAEFEKRFEAWWLAQKPDATVDLYRRAAVQTLTSYLARATSQGQTFESFDAFLHAAKEGQLKYHKEDWLPAYMAREVTEVAPRVGTFTLEPGATNTLPPRLVCVDEDGTKYVGTFQVVGGRVRNIATTVTPPLPPAATKPAADGGGKSATP